MMPNLHWRFLPLLGQGDGCAQLDQMDLDRKLKTKKIVHMLLVPWKKEISHISNDKYNK